MGTISSLLNLAKEALNADQAGLNVTANNVANQTTVGYTREVVNDTAQDSITINGVSYGDGVAAGPATSVRDRVLEQRVQQQTQIQSQSATLQSALEQVESVFGISSSSTSSSLTQLGTTVDALFSSFTALASDPSDAATRQAVLTAASNLASTLNQTSAQITATTSSLQSQVTTTVGEINPLLTQIASLNEKIATTSPNGDAGVLEDQRQAAIAQLSQYIGLDQITTSLNGIDLTTSNGTPLVSSQVAYPLSTAVVSGTLQVYGGDGTNVTSGLTGGAIGGALEALTSTIPTIAGQIDTLAYSIATAVNTQNSAGLTASGTAAGNLFTIGTSSAGAAAAIGVATTDTNAVAAAGTGEGTTGNTNASALAGLATTAIDGTQTASEAVSSTLAQIGEAAETATNDATVQQASLTQLTTQRDALSAVNLDTEASNLTEYQRSYQAASQVFSIVDTLLASAINLGVETAVS